MPTRSEWSECREANVATDKRLHAAPDLVVEILLADTRKVDEVNKQSA